METKTNQNKRFVVPISSIKEGDRIRKDYSHVDELAESIKTNGLLQPIVITLDGTLIAGGSRLRAVKSLGWTEIDVVYFEVADPVTLRILEVEENVRRKAMTWQERVLAITDVHQKQSLYKALQSEYWTAAATGELLGMSQANVSYALELASYLRAGDKEVTKCDRMWDAINLLVKRKAEESNKLLAKMTIPTVDPARAKEMLLTEDLGQGGSIFTPVAAATAGGVSSVTDDGEMPNAPSLEPITVPLSQMVVCADSVKFVSQLPDTSVDHVITDWPFGIDMDNIQQSGGGMDVSATAAEHDVAANEKLHADIVPQIFRVLKDGGFFITWTDFSQWQRNYDLCIAAGFKVQRWPLIWYKTHRCQNMAASYNFTKDYEIAIVCRKGNATLLTPQASSVYMGATDEATRALGHPFAKPPKLWQWLYQAVAHKGQLVLDPFAGVGSSTLAAIEYGLQPLHVELNEKHHAQAVVNVSEFYKRTLQNVRFI